MKPEDHLAELLGRALAPVINQALMQAPREHLTSRVWVTSEEVAERYRISRRTLSGWVRRGLFPPPISVNGYGSYRVWPLSDLERWEQKKLEERK